MRIVPFTRDIVSTSNNGMALTQDVSSEVVVLLSILPFPK